MGKNKSENPEDMQILIDNDSIHTKAKRFSNIDDTRPFEQKNMPKGAFKRNTGSK